MAARIEQVKPVYYCDLLNISLSPQTGRNDLILLTQTPDGTARIFLTVLDAPNLLQLHATVDPYSFLSKSTADPSGSSVHWLDRTSLQRSFDKTRLEADRNVDDEIAQRRRPLAEQLISEGWDLFVRSLPGGSLVVRALAVGTAHSLIFWTKLSRLIYW